jgi:hypothetical protein
MIVLLIIQVLLGLWELKIEGWQKARKLAKFAIRHLRSRVKIFIGHKQALLEVQVKCQQQR